MADPVSQSSMQQMLDRLTDKMKYEIKDNSSQLESKLNELQREIDRLQSDINQVLSKLESIDNQVE